MRECVCVCESARTERRERRGEDDARVLAVLGRKLPPCEAATGQRAHGQSPEPQRDRDALEGASRGASHSPFRDARRHDATGTHAPQDACDCADECAWCACGRYSDARERAPSSLSHVRVRRAAPFLWATVLLEPTGSGGEMRPAPSEAAKCTWRPRRTTSSLRTHDASRGPAWPRTRSCACVARYPRRSVSAAARVRVAAATCVLQRAEPRADSEGIAAFAQSQQP
eukprot:2842020-Pleurochrysis_carterae.AAC.6